MFRSFIFCAFLVPLALFANGNQEEDYMNTMETLPQKYIIGLKIKTSNETFMKDGPPLWGKFHTENIFQKIPNKVNGLIYAVYTDYEGDFLKPYSYMIGCEVSSLDEIPEGLVGITIPKQTYTVFDVKGPFPQSVADAWITIWSSNINRAYTTDFEVYSLSNVEQKTPDIKIYIALKPVK